MEGSKSKLEELFLRNNLTNDECIFKLKELHSSSKSRISIDVLERVKYLDQEKTDRTIWVHPINQINIGSLKQFFENTYKCGIILDFRVRNGKKYPNKKGENKFCFVEFADPASVTQALSLAAQKLTVIGGKKFRVFRAGTGTFVYTKKTAKQRKLEEAKNSLPRMPFPATVPPPLPTQGFSNIANVSNVANW